MRLASTCLHAEYYQQILSRSRRDWILLENYRDIPTRDEQEGFCFLNFDSFAQNLRSALLSWSVNHRRSRKIWSECQSPTRLSYVGVLRVLWTAHL